MLTLLAVLWFVVWLLVVIDMIFRRDMRGWVKVVWAFALLIFPVVGALVYALVRPWDQGGMIAEGSVDQYDVVRDRRPV